MQRFKGGSFHGKLRTDDVSILAPYCRDYGDLVHVRLLSAHILSHRHGSGVAPCQADNPACVAKI